MRFPKERIERIMRKTTKLLYALALTVLPFVTEAADIDDFSDAMHRLAVHTACLGRYSAAKAGIDWEPADYYKPNMLTEYFAKTSDDNTHTSMFYGVCYDYAEAAHHHIKEYKSWYNSMGMYGNRFYIAKSGSNPNVIELEYPVGTGIGGSNGMPAEYVGKKEIQTHKHLDGTRATNHVWLWVQRYDGVWFWIDPTWTDNIGYVVWGYIANGEEVQLLPDKAFCLNLNYSKGLPTVPSEFDNNPIRSAGDSSANLVISAGCAAPFSAVSGGQNRQGYTMPDSFGVSLSIENGNRDAPKFIGIYQLDFYRYDNEYGRRDALLGDFALGLQLASFFALYGGGGLGLSSRNLSALDDAGLAWKVHSGIRLTILKLNIRAEVQYVDGLGASFGAFVGWGF